MYQYFFIAFILFPHSISEYFCLDGKACYVGRDCKADGKFIISIFSCCGIPCASVDTDPALRGARAGNGECHDIALMKSCQARRIQLSCSFVDANAGTLQGSARRGSSRGSCSFSSSSTSARTGCLRCTTLSGVRCADNRVDDSIGVSCWNDVKLDYLTFFICQRLTVLRPRYFYAVGLANT